MPVLPHACCILTQAFYACWLERVNRVVTRSDVSPIRSPKVKVLQKLFEIRFYVLWWPAPLVGIPDPGGWHLRMVCSTPLSEVKLYFNASFSLALTQLSCATRQGMSYAGRRALFISYLYLRIIVVSCILKNLKYELPACIIRMRDFVYVIFPISPCVIYFFMYR